MLAELVLLKGSDKRGNPATALKMHRAVNDELFGANAIERL